jgi:homopolymeric O-antigen transport system permease protein
MKSSMNRLNQELGELVRYRSLLRNLVVRDLTVRYKRSIIGIFWTLINPIIMTVVFSIVFSTVFKFSTKNFIIYFLSGYLFWNFFAQTTLASSQCILVNGNLLRKIYVPKKLFVLSIVLSGLINLGLALIPLIALIILAGKPFDFSLLILPFSLLVLTLFTTGVSLALSSMSVFFIDVISIYQVILQPWMYLTPIVYPLEIIPSKYLPLVHLNPMYHLIACFREPIYSGKLPTAENLICATVASLAVLVVGYVVFSRSEDSFIYYL